MVFNLHQVYKLGDQGYGRAAGQEILRQVEVLCTERNYDEINQVLVELRYDIVETPVIVGLIRYTAAIRDCLPAWETAYFQAFDRIIALGHEPLVMLGNLLV